jgi:hypothetical protein
MEEKRKMLIFNNIDKDKPDEGEWFDRELWLGATVGFKIRARTQEKLDSIRDRFKDMPEGKEKEEKVVEAQNDYFFAEFRSVGDELPDGTVEPWENNIKNKEKLLYMPVPMGMQPNWVWLTNKANERAFKVREVEVKN